jgi:hypothetical protein
VGEHETPPRLAAQVLPEPLSGTADGRVHWARTGGEPFSDVTFLVKQLERMNQ